MSERCRHGNIREHPLFCHACDVIDGLVRPVPKTFARLDTETRRKVVDKSSALTWTTGWSLGCVGKRLPKAIRMRAAAIAIEDYIVGGKR